MVTRCLDISLPLVFLLAHYTCAILRANGLQCVVMTLPVRAFLLMFCGAVLLFALPVTAATPEQCDLLELTNPAIRCDADTPFTRADEANFALTKGQRSPLQFLNDQACKGTIVGCIDPQFAVLVQNFYQAGEEAGKQQGWQMPHVTDGWRSPQSQLKAVASGASKVGPCGSPHNYGLAVDFNDPPLNKGLSPAMKWMRANAHLYGLETIFDPVTGCGRRLCDPAHFQIKGWKNRSVARGQCITSCSAPPSGKVQSCTGGGGGGGNFAENVGNAFSQMTQPLKNLFQEKSQPTPPQPSALPSIKGPDAYGTTTAPVSNTNTNTSSANVPAIPAPQTAEEILAQIAVAPPQATTTATTTRPLTAEEIRYFYEQQARLGFVVPSGYTAVAPVGIQPIPTPPYAGFYTPEELNQEPSQEFITYYYQVLFRVSLALGEISRILRGDTVPSYSIE